jgi:hypothetical protein
MKFSLENYSGDVNIYSGPTCFFHPFAPGMNIHITPESLFTSSRNDYSHAPESAPKAFAALLRALHRQRWVAYVKRAMAGPTSVLRYLGRYTHRVAISNHRLLSFDGERVTFRWKDYARGNKQRLMTLTASEFLRRYAQHILPHGFVRIRQFGFLANRYRAASLALVRTLLLSDSAPSPSPIPSTATWQCPRCGHAMRVGSRLSAQQLISRCPNPDTS